jgi:hypothetical protein
VTRVRTVVFPELFLGLLSLAVAAVVIGQIFASTIHDAKHTADTISITASARKPISSNLVQWTLGVDGKASTPVEAARRSSRASAAVVAFLRRAGIKASAISPEVVQSNVKGLGGKLGRMRASSLGVYQITPRNSTQVSDYGISDTSSRLKDVTAVVSATFAVKQ